MVSAHLEDLQAARQCGYQTVYVEREGEELGSDEEVCRARREGWVDMWIATDEDEAGGGLLEVARRFDDEVVLVAVVGLDADGGGALCG